MGISSDLTSVWSSGKLIKTNFGHPGTVMSPPPTGETTIFIFVLILLEAEFWSHASSKSSRDLNSFESHDDFLVFCNIQLRHIDTLSTLFFLLNWNRFMLEAPHRWHAWCPYSFLLQPINPLMTQKFYNCRAVGQFIWHRAGGSSASKQKQRERERERGREGNVWFIWFYKK